MKPGVTPTAKPAADPVADPARVRSASRSTTRPPTRRAIGTARRTHLGSRLAALAITLGWAGLAAGRAVAEPVLIDGIAAQVGPDIVLVSEVYRLTSPMIPQMRKAGAQEQDVIRFRADALESLIERRLIEQVVRQQEIATTEAEVDQTIAAIAAENGLTLDQLRQSVEHHELGYEAYREQIRGEIQRNKVLSYQVSSRVEVEEADIRSLYEERFGEQPDGGTEMHLRHLMVTFQGSGAGRSQDAVCAEVAQARQRVLAGESFAEIASEISEANPGRGGDVGWVHLDSVAAWMAPAVAELQSGEISEVVRMPFGCNLLFVEERRDFEPVAYNEARGMLHGELFQRGMEREYEEWIETLRARTYIERKGVFAEAGMRLGDSEDVATGPETPGLATP